MLFRSFKISILLSLSLQSLTPKPLLSSSLLDSLFASFSLLSFSFSLLPFLFSSNRHWVCVVVGLCSGGRVVQWVCCRGGLGLCSGFVQLVLVWWMAVGGESWKLGESWRLGGCWVRCWLDFSSGIESMWVPSVVAMGC